MTDEEKARAYERERQIQRRASDIMGCAMLFIIAVCGFEWAWSMFLAWLKP